MRNGKIILAIALFCCITGCKKVEMERVSLEDIPQQALTMERLVRLPGQTPPAPYLLTDSIILLHHSESPSFLGVYKLGETNYQRHSLKKRGDQISVPADAGLQTSFQFFASKMLAKYSLANSVITLDDFTRFSFAHGLSPSQLEQLDKDLYACIGNYPEGIFGLCKREKKEMRYTGEFPIDDPALRQYIAASNTGRMAKHDNQLVYATHSLGYIASYEYKWKRLRKQWEKQVTDFHYTVKEGRVSFDREQHQTGFGNIHITDKHIYTIYWGQTRSMGLEVPNSVVVFDRQGNPLVRYTLPDQMIFISVDSREEYIYATYSPLMNECYLVRFRLSNI